jgi:hypothetical protein
LEKKHYGIVSAALVKRKLGE